MPHLPQNCQSPSVVVSHFEDARHVPGVYPVTSASTLKMRALVIGDLAGWRGVCPNSLIYY